jgi:hypothetical protein
MPKINKEDMPAVLPISRTRNTLLRAQLLQLQVGEGYFLPRADWKTKNSPKYIVAYLKWTHGYVFDYGFKVDGSGWLFRRVA